MPNDECKDALVLADRIMDRPYGDPDDDLAVLSRQLLRRTEEIARLKAEREELVAAMRGCISYRNWEIAEGGVVPANLIGVFRRAEAVLAKIEGAQG